MKMNYLGNNLVKKTVKLLDNISQFQEVNGLMLIFFKLRSFIRQKRQILSRRKLVVHRLFDYLINEVK